MGKSMFLNSCCWLLGLVLFYRSTLTQIEIANSIWDEDGEQFLMIAMKYFLQVNHGSEIAI
jgi:hypothetical protein